MTATTKFKGGKRLSFTDVMRASRWIDKHRAEGVKITGRLLMKRFNVSMNIAYRLKKANLDSKGPL